MRDDDAEELHLERIPFTERRWTWRSCLAFGCLYELSGWMALGFFGLLAAWLIPGIPDGALLLMVGTACVVGLGVAAVVLIKVLRGDDL